MHTMEGKKGEILANGDFATGNFDGWRVVGDPTRIHMTQQEGGNVAVFSPALTPEESTKLEQIWVIPQAGGEYGVSFDFRVSDEHGAPIEGIYRHFHCSFWLHPHRESEQGLWLILNATAVPYWRTRSHRLTYEAQFSKKMQFYVYDPGGDGDGIPRPDNAPENTMIVNVPDPIQLSEEHELVPGVVHIAFRNFRAFKIR
ncbi:hypothetical protein PAN31117_03897 [Pandoraea anapnoica]|uniref:Uncharacterized protein n=1 Tax=Pandoraea anapnoica TaxID=2508301 RepID=A0A5E5ABL6_9BURK|nr:hypothetical protein [Pandoraea anapnoica]VVE71021.1 hypothetical protein PAN31117_03897 [Pandoraea anapnoica]